MSDASLSWPPSTPLLWLEFLALFLCVPLGIAFLIGVISPIVWLLLLVPFSLWLLHRTPEFQLSDLLQGPVIREWPLIAGFTLLSGALIFGVAYWQMPGRFLEIFRYDHALWLTIMALYPLFSALPQELIFRTLFFERYGRLFPTRHAAVAANAAAFSLAHLFFFHPVTLALTALGGAVFALAYLRERSTLFAIVLHSIAGQLIFTSGLGIYFYHGAIGH